MHSVYIFATDTVTFSTTVVLVMKYCMSVFARYSNYTNGRWAKQSMNSVLKNYKATFQILSILVKFKKRYCKNM